jgi:hypothetical protein
VKGKEEVERNGVGDLRFLQEFIRKRALLTLSDDSCIAPLVLLYHIQMRTNNVTTYSILAP